MCFCFSCDLGNFFDAVEAACVGFVAIPFGFDPLIALIALIHSF